MPLQPSAAPPAAHVGGTAGRTPPPLRPYLELMRVDRPVGTWLVVLPGWVALALAGGFPPDLRSACALFVLGFLTRSAGCTFNDIVDRRFDAQVSRTVDRPLAAGRLGVGRAWAFFALQLLILLTVPLFFGPTMFLLNAAGWVLILAYPFMKRITDWPHVWLGPCMSWLALVAWIAVTGSLDATAAVLFVGLSCWAVGCDIVYAHQDRESDAAAGVRSAAVLLGPRSVFVLAGVYAAALVCFAVAGQRAGLGFAFWPLLAVAGAQLRWQLRVLDIDDPQCCRRVFLSNPRFGALVLLAVLAGKAL